jgi:hypothetical protein
LPPEQPLETGREFACFAFRKCGKLKCHEQNYKSWATVEDGARRTTGNGGELPLRRNVRPREQQKRIACEGKDGYEDFKEGFCNLWEHDFKTKSGYASMGEGGLISFGVHGNCNYTFRAVGEIKGVCVNSPLGKRPENVRMQNFLSQNGITAKAKYLGEGSMRGCWRLYWPDVPWTQELADCLNELGFTSAHHEPLDQFSGNGGSFSVCVRGHDELLAEIAPEMEAAPVADTNKPVAKAEYSPALVEELKQADQDHEFYPTTDAIIRALARDIGLKSKDGYRGHSGHSSVLDVGAGNGKVLLALREATELEHLHAIEKSSILCRNLDPDIMVIGTDFAEQSLLSKQVDVIFCNPPYSQFEEWAEKIIRQAASKVVYLVIPKRWESSQMIKDALKFREAHARKVGEFDFEDAEDRTARAQVHLLRISLEDRKPDDAFERFFQEQFAHLIKKFTASEPKKDQDSGRDEPRPFQKLVLGPNYPEAMVNLYRQEMANIEKNYQLVGQLDVDLLREFDISPSKIMECLKARLSGLRNDYWSELFSRLNTITDRLTSKSRKTMLDTLHKHVHVDFTVSNIYEIIVWLIKNANRYIESQLIDTYELMVDKCNVQLYKSNKKVWVDQGWRYNGDPDKNSHYALDYRIVTHRVGGIRVGYSFERGLDERACDFLGDLLTLAKNLGFRCDTSQHLFSRSGRDEWVSGQGREFYFIDGDAGRTPIYDVKAFKNGNLHLRLHKSFILALNVEFGRLKGWLRSGEQAADELNDPAAASCFKSNLQIEAGNPALMLTVRTAV